jgi:hypothetical protein
MRNALLGLLLSVTLTTNVFCQDSLRTIPPDSTTGQSWGARKTIATALSVGFLGGSLVGSYFDWWNNDAKPFHFVREGFWNDYASGVDKFGHAYTSYCYFHIFRNIMLWGGFSDEAAFWWPLGGSAFFAISVEVGDGLSSIGFSFEDLTANTLGLTYAVLQSKFPFLNNIQMKWSYVPPDGYRWPPRFTDHYDGHTYWFTFNMHNLLPDPVGSSWPEWLNFAVGYKVDDNQSRHALVVGFDFNLGAFTTSQPDLVLARNTLDLFHLPVLPAVKMTEEKHPRWYGVFLY